MARYAALFSLALLWRSCSANASDVEEQKAVLDRARDACAKDACDLLTFFSFIDKGMRLGTVYWDLDDAEKALEVFGEAYLSSAERLGRHSEVNIKATAAYANVLQRLEPPRHAEALGALVMNLQAVRKHDQDHHRKSSAFVDALFNFAMAAAAAEGLHGAADSATEAFEDLHGFG